LALAALAVVTLAPAAGSLFALAFAVAMVGGLGAVLRRDAQGVQQAAGVMVLENGLVLALGTATGLAGAAPLALATAALPAAAVLVLLRRIVPLRSGA
jgi:hypothetical protein